MECIGVDIGIGIRGVLRGVWIGQESVVRAAVVMDKTHNPESTIYIHLNGHGTAQNDGRIVGNFFHFMAVEV